MRAFFYDTETTDLPKYGEPSEAAEQPHIVSVCGVLVDLDAELTPEGDYRPIATIDLLVKPDGWGSCPEALDTHGITDAHADAFGLPEDLVTDMVFSMALRAHVRIGYNEPYDQRILRIALKRGLQDEAAAAAWAAQPTFCAMAAARKIMGGKNPKLADAHARLVGYPMERAHTAAGDVLAAMRVYRALVRHGAGYVPDGSVLVPRASIAPAAPAADGDFIVGMG